MAKRVLVFGAADRRYDCRHCGQPVIRVSRVWIHEYEDPGADDHQPTPDRHLRPVT